MNEKHDVEVIVLDGSTVLTRATLALDHLPSPGDEWSLDRDWDDLASRFQEKGEVTRVAIQAGQPARLEVQARFSRSQAERPIVTLNEYRIAHNLRNNAAKALLRHPSSPLVMWQASPEPRTILHIKESNDPSGFNPLECEAILDSELEKAACVM